MASIYSGIKILDLTKVFSGPFSTRLFADYGAEVIKIENPDFPDDTRNYAPIKNNWSGYYEILNRNKKGISLNLKNDEDLNTFYKLIKEADVFVENLTPSTKSNLKIDYEKLKEINPRLIYASLSGVGQNEDKKYYDIIAQAQSGLMSLSGENGHPMKIGPSVVDAFSGMTLSFGIASALYSREKTGKGQYLDVSMLSAAMNLLESNLIDYSVFRKNPSTFGNQDNTIAPFGVFKASDGYLVVAAGNDNLWNVLSLYLKNYVEFDASIFTSNELRLKNLEPLTQIIEKAFSEFKVAELLIKLQELEIPCSSVSYMSDVANDNSNFENKRNVKLNHSKLGEIIVPGKSINFTEFPDFEVREAPDVGENNSEYGI